MPVEKSALIAFAKRERDRFEQTLKEFVEIPSVSSEPQRQRDIRRSADLAAQTIRDFGGEPAIFASVAAYCFAADSSSTDSTGIA